MKSYICDNCGHINELEECNEESTCSNCKATYEKLRLIENQIAENEIDAIIDSVIEDINDKKEEKIINKNEENKFLEFDESNTCIKRNSEKCINCGQCKKTCEKYANLKYDLNKCLHPVCIGCGECVKNCPTKAITYKEEYVEVKEVIDKNEKIVIAIVEPNVPLILSHHYNIDAEIIDGKLNEALKKIGFDYTFNSGFGCDINVIEEVSEFVERLKNKQLLPLMSTSSYSIIKYLEIYHPQVINNISTSKNPLLIQNEIIKRNFCDEKGFNKEKIITVGITNCISDIMKIKEDNYNLDYIITVDELIKMIDREKINLNDLSLREYDGYTNFSTSAKILNIPGGKSEVFIKTFCKLVNKTKKSVNEIDESLFMNINGIKEFNINIGKYELRLAIVNSIYELDYIITSGNYKKYHYIEININKNGFLDGNGYFFENNEDKEKLKEIIYKNVNKYPFENKNVKQFYSNGYNKPLSEKSIEILHESYDNKSNILTNL